MKYYELERKADRLDKTVSLAEDVFIHDEDDRPGLRFMLYPLFILQIMAVLSNLI